MRRAGRTELAEKEQAEIEFIEVYRKARFEGRDTAAVEAAIRNTGASSSGYGHGDEAAQAKLVGQTPMAKRQRSR